MYIWTSLTCNVVMIPIVQLRARFILIRLRNHDPVNNSWAESATYTIILIELCCKVDLDEEASFLYDIESSDPDSSFRAC